MDSIATKAIGTGGNGEKDPLFEQAVDVVRKSNKASISLVQRSLQIRYNHAARLVEAMEAAGVVTPPMYATGLRKVVPA